jgi:hypothetical protein
LSDGQFAILLDKVEVDYVDQKVTNILKQHGVDPDRPTKFITDVRAYRESLNGPLAEAVWRNHTFQNPPKVALMHFRPAGSIFVTANQKCRDQGQEPIWKDAWDKALTSQDYCSPCVAQCQHVKLFSSSFFAVLSKWNHPDLTITLVNNRRVVSFKGIQVWPLGEYDDRLEFNAYLESRLKLPVGLTEKTEGNLFLAKALFEKTFPLYSRMKGDRFDDEYLVYQELYRQFNFIYGRGDEPDQDFSLIVVQQDLLVLLKDLAKFRIESVAASELSSIDSQDPDDSKKKAIVLKRSQQLDELDKAFSFLDQQRGADQNSCQLHHTGQIQVFSEEIVSILKEVFE